MSARASRGFGGVVVSTDYWPVILLEFPEQRITDEALHGSLRFIEELLQGAKVTGERTYMITDLSRMHQLPPESHRTYATAWVGRTLALHDAASLGGATVTPSTILRGLVTLINWWHDSDRPTSFVATRKEAFAVAVKAFDRADVRLRPELRARLTDTNAPPRTYPPAR